MTPPDATSTLASCSLLRPFRFDGLSVGQSESAPKAPAGDAKGFDVLLALDFAGSTGAGLDERLVDARGRLGRSGVLLIALPNRFGLRFWSGCPEPVTGQLFATLASDHTSAQAAPAASDRRLFVSRNELAAALEQAGFESLEWFCAVPDAHGSGDSGALLSERLVAAAPELVADIAWARPSADPLRPRLDLFVEALVGRELARAGLFSEFNSHFLVAAAVRGGSAGTSIWPRLRPPALEVGWHFAAGRREPIESIFELVPAGIVVDKRRLTSAAPLDFGRFLWTPPAKTALAPGEPLRLRLQSHLVAGRSAAFLGEFGDFYAATAQRFRPAGEEGSKWIAGEALDALLTNVTRASDGEFHFFDLEWRSPGDLPASWWILRNVAACLDMLGPRFPEAATGAELYALLCRRIGVSPQLEADLAQEAEFGAAVRSGGAENPAALATALGQLWPTPVAQGLEPAAIRSATQLAATHQGLIAAYRELELWAEKAQQRATSVEIEYHRLASWAKQVEQEQEAVLAENRRLATWAVELEAQLLRRDREHAR